MDDSWTAAPPSDGPVALRGWYELSERTFARPAAPAEIPVEKARAELLLVAGGDDAMWPSLPFAERLAERRRSAGAAVRLITHHCAGHRPRLPGKGPATPSPRFRYGGTPEADALLGAAAWCPTSLRRSAAARAGSASAPVRESWAPPPGSGALGAPGTAARPSPGG
ncbi:acyl-CoA thioester hydrolase/BAAT C-terminal domain-containing protein [Streptomyces narbonensis]|uniref:acyl-CoA thioester hydrolase/BAAT C-terminal domain-containing protein n=1 Tax=Streptomyces narbonensis TaxID=67333 RepID=UPI00167624CF|nr:acyl-CoA thioester hydrolase/BAAT C-terminal domain-containing protein [Streptomyces narbonensis]